MPNATVDCTRQNVLREGRSQRQGYCRPVKLINDSAAVLGTSKDIPSVTRRALAEETFASTCSTPGSKAKSIAMPSKGGYAIVSSAQGTRSVSTQPRDPEEVLLIGGAGYIGSVLVRKMLQRG